MRSSPIAWADAKDDAPAGRIALYEGTLSEPSAVTALLTISRGGYDPSVRAAAQSILQGDLKIDILNEEE